MIIRRYIGKDKDLAGIEKINPFLALQIQYHQGVLPENVFCAEKGGAIAGAGFLVLHQTRDTGQLKITFSTGVDSAHQEEPLVESLLVDALQKRFCEIRDEKPGVSVYLCAYYEAGETENMQLLLEKGFSIHAAIPVLKFDLSQEIRRYPIPQDVAIERLPFNEANMEAYLGAAALAGLDTGAETDIWFQTGDPSFTCYAAKCRGAVIGAISVFHVSGERGATENIFVIPQYRRRDIAREMIAVALTQLKAKGLKTATLSLAGTNLPAMHLYLSSGYRLYYQLIEMHYE